MILGQTTMLLRENIIKKIKHSVQIQKNDFRHYIVESAHCQWNRIHILVSNESFTRSLALFVQWWLSSESVQFCHVKVRGWRGLDRVPGVSAPVWVRRIPRVDDQGTNSDGWCWCWCWWTGWFLSTSVIYFINDTACTWTFDSSRGNIPGLQSSILVKHEELFHWMRCSRVLVVFHWVVSFK